MRAHAAEQEHLIYALEFELSKVEDRGIHERMLQLLVRIEPRIANRVALAIGMPAPPHTPVCTHFNV